MLHNITCKCRQAFTGHYQVFGRQVSQCHNRIKFRSIWGGCWWKGKSNHSRWKKVNRKICDKIIRKIQFGLLLVEVFFGDSSTKSRRIRSIIANCKSIVRQLILFSLDIFFATKLIFSLLWIYVMKFMKSQPWSFLSEKFWRCQNRLNLIW